MRPSLASGHHSSCPKLTNTRLLCRHGQLALFINIGLYLSISMNAGFHTSMQLQNLKMDDRDPPTKRKVLCLVPPVCVKVYLHLKPAASSQSFTLVLCTVWKGVLGGAAIHQHMLTAGKLCLHGGRPANQGLHHKGVVPETAQVACTVQLSTIVEPLQSALAYHKAYHITFHDPQLDLTPSCTIDSGFTHPGMRVYPCIISRYQRKLACLPVSQQHQHFLPTCLCRIHRIGHAQA